VATKLESVNEKMRSILISIENLSKNNYLFRLLNNILYSRNNTKSDTEKEDNDDNSVDSDENMPILHNDGKEEENDDES
jgi:hypothetical protein